MPKKQPLHENAKISGAVLKIIAERGWKEVTLDGVAKATAIPLLTLKKRLPTKLDFVPLMAEEIDREAFKTVRKSTLPPQEVLFDILMARFDVLQKNRKAILAMATEACRDRTLSCALGRATLDGLYRVIDAARIRHMARPLLAASLGVIYAWTFLIWSKDTSHDMAKTMATLDRLLRRAAKLYAILQDHTSSA